MSEMNRKKIERNEKIKIKIKNYICIMVNLQITKENIDLIISGTKKNEWRALSEYNKKLLLKKEADGKYYPNKEIKKIKHT